MQSKRKNMRLFIFSLRATGRGGSGTDGFKRSFKTAAYNVLKGLVTKIAGICRTALERLSLSAGLWPSSVGKFTLL